MGGNDTHGHGGARRAARGERRGENASQLPALAHVFARGNLFLVPLLALAIFVTTTPRGPLNLARIFGVALVLTNLAGAAVAAACALSRRVRPGALDWGGVLLAALASVPLLGLASAGAGGVFRVAAGVGWLGAATGPARYGVGRTGVIVGALGVWFLGAFAHELAAQERLQRALEHVHEVRRKQRRAAAARRRAEAGRLAALLRPHFLFNAFNALAGLVRRDPERAEALTLTLARYFRRVLEAGERELVPLERELEAAREYLGVERLRLGDRLRYEVRGMDGLDHVPVPAMILQPLLENAVKHGVAAAADAGSVRVHAQSVGGRLRIDVEDDGPGFGASPEAPGSGSGLEIVRRRLELHYGLEATLSLHRDHGAGRTTASLEIPLQPGAGIRSEQS